jgi:hypothetical protein
MAKYRKAQNIHRLQSEASGRDKDYIASYRTQGPRNDVVREPLVRPIYLARRVLEQDRHEKYLRERTRFHWLNEADMRGWKAR